MTVQVTYYITLCISVSFRRLTTFSITGCRWLPYASITARVSAPSTAASSGIGIGDSFVSDICTVHDGDKGFLQGLRGQTNH